MKKIIVFIIILIIAIVLGTLFYINANGASIIASFLSNQLKREVTVERASLGFNEINLSEVRVHNPTNSSLPDDFKVSEVEIKFDFKTIFKDTIEIHKITLTDPTIFLELYNLNGSDNNWKSIFKDLTAPVSSTQSQEKNAPKNTKFIIIDTFVINGLHIQAQHRMLGPYSLNVPIKNNIVFHNLTNHQALAYKVALSVIFTSILESISNLKGFKEVFKEIKLPSTIPTNILENIQTQAPQAQPDEEVQTSIEDSWIELKKEVQEAPKKIKQFFDKLFK